MPTKNSIQKSLAILGVADDSIAEIASQFPDWDKTPDAFIEEFASALSQANAGYTADWRGDAFGLLVYAAARSSERGQRVIVDHNRGKPTVDLGDDGFFAWQGSKMAKHNDLASGWNEVAPDVLQLRTVAYWDKSDTQLFIALTSTDWQRLEELLGPLFSQLFTVPRGKGGFAAKPRPKPKKINWAKEFVNIIPPFYQDATKEKDFRIEELGDKVYHKLKLALEIPPTGSETRKRAHDTFREVTQVFECVSFKPIIQGENCRTPVTRWFLRHDKTDLATCWYARSLLAHLLFLWELYFWHWAPVNVSRVPEYLPSMHSKPVHLPMAWFTLQALGCEQEAARIAPLLEQPVLHGMWYTSAKQKDHGWMALARWLASGVKTPDLMYVDAVLPLLEVSAWEDEETLTRALQVNLREGGDECESDGFDYRCWPAPFYALARRLGVDLSKFDNPFLSLPLDAREIRRDIRLIQNVATALDKFAKLDKSAFRGMRPDALVPPLAAELKAKIKERRKDRDDQVYACHCGSIYLVHELGGDAQRDFHYVRCEICGEEYTGRNRAFETELLIAITSDRI